LKKILLVFFGLVILILAIVYLSLWSHPAKAETDIVIGRENIDKIDFRHLDSVTVAASTMYESTLLKEIMQGEQYRAEWAEPIKVPVVYLDKIHGGLRIIKKGGGKQTQSLRLKNEIGVVYTLRSVAKDPTPLIPDWANTLGIENIIVDGISAQHPYGAMAVARLAEALDLPHTPPRLVFIPKQEGLGEFTAAFGNKLYWLEYETEGQENWSDFKDIVALIDTEELQEQKWAHKDKLHIDTQALVEKENRKCIIIAGDLRQQSFCKAAVERCVEVLKKIDILVNNAAVQFPKDTLGEITNKQLKTTFETNIYPYFYITRAALEHMDEGGAIVNTSSVTAYRGSDHLLDYSSTKGAIVAFTRSLSQNLVKRKIRVNGVAPGPIWTPLIPATFDDVTDFGQDTPMGRAGQPSEVAPAYVFLASADASYITGQFIHVNGGEQIGG